MESNDFDRWYAEHVAAFPDLQRWLSELPNSQDALRVWRETLADVRLEDAWEITRRMSRGDVEPPKAYERERTAARVRRLAKELEYESRKAENEREERREAASRGHCQPIGPLIRRAMAVGTAYREGKLSSEERDSAVAEIRKEAGSDPNAAEPRYGCGICLDHGWVEVWAPDVVQQIRLTRKEPGRVTSCAVACSCTRGDRFAEPKQVASGRAVGRPLPRYDSAVYCKLKLTSTAAESRALMDWLFDGENVADGRYTDFDTWNAGA